MVAEIHADGGTGGGNGNLTQHVEYVDADTTRTTSYTYDWRDRRVTTDGEEDYFEQVYYDHLDRVVKTERYDTTVEGNLIARSETDYDDLGRVYQRRTYAVDPTTGLTGHV